MKEIISKIILLTMLLFTVNKGQDLTKYVDPFIGTGGHGHTYPGATVPFGMVQLSPDTRIGNWDACGGYHYSDSTIIGFSHQHLSGVGVLDYGDILFMPTVGEIQLTRGNENNTAKGFRSKFKHSTEIAEPGYYSVFLEDYKIKAELTATTRTGFHKYTFPQKAKNNLIIDLTHQLEPGEKIISTEFEVIDKNKIRGLRRSSGWAADQVVYFYAELSKSIIDYGIFEDSKKIDDQSLVKGKSIKAFLKFNNKDSMPLLIKVGISAVDYEGAKKNLFAENPNWDFEEIKNKAKEKWNKQLSKIIVKDNSCDKKTIFYTALYHSSIIPNIYFDVDRRYRGNDRQIHVCEDFDNYTIFSLWDTFRATHPLLALIDKERTKNFIKSMLAIYKESGFLPKWELAGNETGTMIGYHSVPVILDAYINGITDFDTELALEAMIKSATNDVKDLNFYNKIGFIPSDRDIESVSKTLEYSYDDWCIYQFAKLNGNKKVAKQFEKRAKSYMNLFDGETGFFRGKKFNGNWDAFDPFEISRNYTEANAWQYSMFVPHDINNLINLYGTKEQLILHLDKMFTAEKEFSGHDIPDVTGLIGQYAHGNEPSHHVAYIYNFLDQPWKTQERINQINKEMYSTNPDGLSGNEDCGQMSSWFNLSSMGFYPFCPGTNEYQIGTPFFEEVKINLENGKSIIIKAENLNDKNFYIQSMTVNGSDWTKSFIKNSDLTKGAEIKIVMGAQPNNKWGVNNISKPYSLTKNKTVSIPYLTNDVGYFSDEIEIEFKCRTKDAEIRYTLDGSEPNKNSELYTEKFKIDHSLTIKARAYKDNYEPSVVFSSVATKAEYLKPSYPKNVKHGVHYKYYEDLFSSVYDIEKSKTKKEGQLNYFTLDEAEIEDHYAFIYEGYLNIPEDGIYTFHCKSDDGSVLLIQDKEIVNNDGSHGAISTSGTIALRKGYHPYKLLYFEDYEGNSIEVFWESKNINKEKIPSSKLYIK